METEARGRRSDGAYVCAYCTIHPWGNLILGMAAPALDGFPLLNYRGLCRIMNFDLEIISHNRALKKKNDIIPH